MLENDAHVNALHNRLKDAGRNLAQSRLRTSEGLALLFGVISVMVHAGMAGATAERVDDVSWLVVLCMAWISISQVIRVRLESLSSNVTQTAPEQRLVLPGIWLVGVVALCVSGLWLPRWDVVVLWTELLLSSAGVLTILSAFRTLATRTRNSAVLLVGSFLLLIFLGTVLLSLPICRAPGPNGERPTGASLSVALFTATSASCVTGLTVVPTGSYWSTTGHAVIIALIQIGGLGILTFGAFIAVLSGRRGLQFGEARTLKELLDAESVNSSRNLLVTILLFTACIEAFGALMLSGLWSNLPPGQRAWHAVFHSVSAFCNAGFSLHDNGLMGMGTYWQVWGPLAFLIILGGLGFPVVYDLWIWTCRAINRTEVTPLFRRVGIRPHLSLHSRLVLLTTVCLLLGGAAIWFLLESLAAPPESSVVVRIADAWFQSVTFRTAGYNTVDHALMQPATKLLGVFLMFIGAAPGSTGGGIKTIVFAITILNIRAVLQGHTRIEAFGRRLSVMQVSRALSMIALGLMIVMGSTGLLVIFERKPDRFLDHLFEATSAFATVGVTAGITNDLTLPSRMLICVVMFLGRVGPITLLLAMASPSESQRYDYPEERVSLG